MPRVSCPAGIDAYLAECVSTGNLIQLDGAAHARIRRLLISEFSAPRMRALRPYIARIVDEYIDAMLAQDQGPVDFVEEFAVPTPALVIAEMLGVPPGDRADFQVWGRTANQTAGRLHGCLLLSTLALLRDD